MKRPGKAVGAYVPRLGKARFGFERHAVDMDEAFIHILRKFTRAWFG